MNPDDITAEELAEALAAETGNAYAWCFVMAERILARLKPKAPEFEVGDFVWWKNQEAEIIEIQKRALIQFKVKRTWHRTWVTLAKLRKREGS